MDRRAWARVSPSRRAFRRWAASDRQWRQPPPVQVNEQLAPPAQICEQPPPEQLKWHVAPPAHVCAQPPPEQKPSHDFPPGHVCVQ